MHWKNLKYLIRHKWYVLKMGLKYRVWWHQLIIHDWTKFLPIEWFGYARFFYGKKYPSLEELKRMYPGDSRIAAMHMLTSNEVKAAFDRAWNHHQKWNPHHWQYWVMLNDSGGQIALEMPERFVREMVADWAGASMAIRGYDDTIYWYKLNCSNMILHPDTRKLVERLIGYPRICRHEC